MRGSAGHGKACRIPKDHHPVNAVIVLAKDDQMFTFLQLCITGLVGYPVVLLTPPSYIGRKETTEKRTSLSCPAPS